MLRETEWEPLALKFLLARSGCEIRQTVFGWTMPGFPFSLKKSKKLKIREPHVITVTGKAFYDVAHAPANHSNRRANPKDYAVVGNSSCDENGSGPMKYWEVIADNLSTAGWSWGCVASVDSRGRTIFVPTRIVAAKSVNAHELAATIL